MDGLDAVSVGEAVAKAQPDAIVHQMTAISVAYAGKPDMKHMDRWFATTNRLRTDGTSTSRPCCCPGCQSTSSPPARATPTRPSPSACTPP